MKLTDANKIRDYVKEQINPYGKPFEGSVYDFGLKIMNYIDNMSADYDLDRVVEELEKESYQEFCDSPKIVELKDAIEIVKQGGVDDDVFLTQAEAEQKLKEMEAKLRFSN